MSNYHFDVNLDGSSSKVNLLYISHSRDENDWSSIMHSHLFSELLYIEKGKGELFQPLGYVKLRMVIENLQHGF